MSEGEEEEVAAAGLAELEEAGRERAVRGMVTGDELRALAKQRSLDTPVSRIARQEAAASLSSVARAQAAHAERIVGLDEELGEEDRVRVASTMKKLEECRNRILAVRIQRSTAGAIKSRSQRFLAEYRAIENGNSEISVWQALQEERQRQKNR
eukprot:9627656-Alexandrium_andersonii.AAC.1